MAADRGLRKSDNSEADVVEIVAVKALQNHSEPQLSIAWPQSIQSKTVIFTRFQHTSTIRKIWFGTRGSEVQILSPRPIKSITYSRLIPIKKSNVDDVVAANSSKSIDSGIRRRIL